MPNRPPTHKPPGMPARQQQQRQYDERRGPKRQFYSSKAWRDFRKAFLASHPLCADCGEQERLTLATEVHHEKKREDYPELTFDEDNCRPLCQGCHSRRTRRGE